MNKKISDKSFILLSVIVYIAGSYLADVAFFLGGKLINPFYEYSFNSGQIFGGLLAWNIFLIIIVSDNRHEAKKVFGVTGIASLICALAGKLLGGVIETVFSLFLGVVLGLLISLIISIDSNLRKKMLKYMAILTPIFILIPWITKFMFPLIFDREANQLTSIVHFNNPIMDILFGVLLSLFYSGFVLYLTFIEKKLNKKSIDISFLYLFVLVITAFGFHYLKNDKTMGFHYNVYESLYIDHANIKINATDKNGYKLLDYAIKSEHTSENTFLGTLYFDKIVKRTNVKSHVASNGIAPLHWACAKKDYQLVETLIRNGADVNASANDGISPLSVLFFQENLWNSFYNKYFKYHERNYKNSYKKQIKILGSRGKTENETTADYLSIIELLVKNGADVNAKDYYGNSPMHYAALIGIKHSKKIRRPIEALYEAGANLNSTNTFGDTPLHFAMFAKNKTEAEVLARLGADANIKNAKLHTPIETKPPKNTNI